MMYNEEMEALIQAALQDGVVTDKEREILKRRAAKEGIDVDEFEMVLDARIAKLQKETNTPPPAPTQNKTSSYQGDVRKCPACGTIVPPLSLRCPGCGVEFRNAEANQTAMSLKAALEAIDHEEDTGGYYMSGNSPLAALGNNLIGSFMSDKRKRKVQIIQTTPIPNTREDLLEMLMLCTGNAEYNTSNTAMGASELTEAWRAKTRQVILKTEMLLKDDPDAKHLVAEAKKTLGKWSPAKKMIVGYIAFLVIGGLVCLLISMFM